MKTNVTFPCVFLAALIAAPVGGVQSDASVADALKPGATVRIETLDRTRTVVDGAQLDGDRIVIGAGGSRWIPVDDVVSIDRRVSGAGRGAAIGAMSGGLLGVVAITALAVSFSNSFGGSETGATFAAAGLMGAMGGALAGAGIGALLGSPTKRWKGVYRAEEQGLALSLVLLEGDACSIGMEGTVRF